MNTLCVANFLPFISQIRVLSNYRQNFGGTPVADSDGQFLSDIDVPE